MKKQRILVVDDDRDIREVLSMVLKDCGYEVKLESNGLNTLKDIRSFHPDLILLDMMLSGADGRVICNDLKISEETCNIPIIMLSATYNLSEALHERCQPNDYMQKPFDIWELINKIKYALAA